jgi:hypothetical protein
MRRLLCFLRGHDWDRWKVAYNGQGDAMCFVRICPTCRKWQAEE